MKKMALVGATLVDGSGAPAYQADVLVAGDKIAAIGKLTAWATDELEQIDCQGLVIAPGFIDVHTHDDAIVLQQPDMLPKLSQGITTVIVGNCGISLLPFKTTAPQAPLTLLGEHSFQYDSVEAYQHAYQKIQPSVNVALLVGHTTLRFAAMADTTQAANPSELTKMQDLLAQCLQQGAIGLSSGLFYEPAAAAPSSEVTELVKVVAQYDGVYTSHLRSEMAGIIESMHEAADCARQATTPLVISHHKCAGPQQWGRTVETLPLIEQFAQRQAINMDVYPYHAGSTVLREDLVDGVIDIMVTWSNSHPEMEGRYLKDIAAEWQVTEQEACRRLQPGGACYFQMRQDDVDRVLTHPLAMIGSDGLPHDRHPHPRLYGAFPRVLKQYWRERQLLSLEQAVHKMTGLSAQTFKVPQRGLLKPDYYADLVVFDPNMVGDTATYENPKQLAQGIQYVFVNGVLSYQPQKVVARRGKLLLER